MKLGLLSDTHNQLPESRRALDLLLALEAQHLVHAGDAGENVVELLSALCRRLQLRAHVAIGNCDRASLADGAFFPQPPGIERGPTLEFVLEHKRCLVLHGDQFREVERALSSGKYDYVFTGHTHEPHDQRVNRTRWINPGSAVRPRRGPPTAAVLNLTTDELIWIPVA